MRRLPLALALALALATSLLLASLPATADPILSVTPSADVALSPTQTVLTFQVDPNDLPLAGLVFNFSALASGLTIVAIQSLDVDVEAFGPSTSAGQSQASFVGDFTPDRSAPFTVGTVTVEGFTAATALVLSGSWTGGGPSFPEPPIGPQGVAVVVPEPSTALVLAQGLLLLALARPRSAEREHHVGEGPLPFRDGLVLRSGDRHGLRAVEDREQGHAAHAAKWSTSVRTSGRITVGRTAATGSQKGVFSPP